ncbi:MAG: c-type cytochrome biogenesis protein CcmI, partial [Gammaproteobacteria bacterium]|nr:c-type cytochrome biogenesis protein CcmI [Gammaproteobacteria bacterium]
SLDEMVLRLEQRLQDNPEDAEGWQMLGRSYVVLSRYPEAVEAYNQARQLSGDTDVNAITGYAEALAMVRGGVVDQESAALFERALQLAPDDRKALWYGGLAAFERGQAGVARSRWQALLKLNPPEQMAQLLREQIAAADVMLGDTPAVAESPGPAAAEPVAGVALTVSLASELAGRLAPDAPLFILARQIDTPGPPLAVVRRRAADLPIQVVLSDADAMVAGRVLSAHSSVEVVARVALGGTPNAQPGDLSGSKIVPSSGAADVVIDTIVGN